VTPLNIIYNSISGILTCILLLQRAPDIAPDVFHACNPACQRLELHYRTNRSPKASDELDRIRQARRLESTTRFSLVNLGMICPRFETRPTLPAAFLLLRGVGLKSFHSPSRSFSYPNFEPHKSRFIFRRLCTYTPPIYFRPR